ncbi:MAG: DUF2284 domain-containing protein [Lachnospiraceae bacterium]
MTIQEFMQYLLENGAYKVGLVDVVDITFDPVYRSYCEANSCGHYGKSWMCPPDAGDIHDLIAHAKEFEKAIVYQTVGELEDSYDIEGMQDASREHNKFTQKIQQDFVAVPHERALHLGAGGCHVCQVCAKMTNEPCRFPDKALCSLETYGIGVSDLANISGMNYINGKNTVTYFGAVFFI